MSELGPYRFLPVPRKSSERKRIPASASSAGSGRILGVRAVIPGRLRRYHTHRQEVALLAIAQADVLQPPLIHPAQIGERHTRVCHCLASVERDLRGHVGLAIGIFEQIAQLPGNAFGRIYWRALAIRRKSLLRRASGADSTMFIPN